MIRGALNNFNEDAWTTLVKTSSFSVGSTAVAADSELVFVPVPGEMYLIHIIPLFTGGAGNGTLRLQIDGTGGMQALGHGIRLGIGPSPSRDSQITNGGAAILTGVNLFTSGMPKQTCWLQIFAVFDSTTSVKVHIGKQAATGGDFVLEAGSVMRYRTI